MTQNARKLESERRLLELVYDPSQYDAVVHEDSPDFRLVRDEKSFGVEVTELFRDESDARLLKVEDYMSSLWAGEKHRNRVDEKRLNVVKFTVTDENGTVKATDVVGILRESPTRQEHYDALAALIERKNAAFAGYKTDLTHTNLLIADHFDGSVTVSGEWSTDDLFTPRLREAVRVTPFRSIIVIGHVGYADSRWIPLDLMWLWEAFMLYINAIYETPGAPEALDEQDAVVLFVDAMTASGWPVELRQEGDELFAAAGGFSMRYGADGFRVHDFADRENGRQKERPGLLGNVDAELVTEINRRFEDFRDNGVAITTEYGRDVRLQSEVPIPPHQDYHLEAIIPPEASKD